VRRHSVVRDSADIARFRSLRLCNPKAQFLGPRFVSRIRSLTSGFAQGYVSLVWKVEREFRLR
jgi:hypothetical protein